MLEHAQGKGRMVMTGRAEPARACPGQPPERRSASGRTPDLGARAARRPVKCVVGPAALHPSMPGERLGRGASKLAQVHAFRSDGRGDLESPTQCVWTYAGPLNLPRLHELGQDRPGNSRFAAIRRSFIRMDEGTGSRCSIAPGA